jgi:hypothetical protein
MGRQRSERLLTWRDDAVSQAQVWTVNGGIRVHLSGVMR